VKLFGFRPLQSLLSVTLLYLAVGCSSNSYNGQVSGEVKTRIPWAAEGGAYSLQEVLLQGISSISQLSGKFATFYMYPSVQGGKISGVTPKTRFLKAGDVYVPEDIATQQMTVIYAHLQNLAQLDEKMGAGTVNQWPRDVGISVRFTDHGSYMTNNAFYDGETDSMLIVPYVDEDLPIPVNAGILAHEHFHSLYFKLVEKKIFEARLPNHGENLRREILGTKAADSSPHSENEDYHQSLSRGINEGLADFWAWVYTGDPDFLASSVPSEKAARTLTAYDKARVPTAFLKASDFKRRLDNSMSKSEVGEFCQGEIRVAYCLGTDYARTLKYLAGLVQDTRGLSPIESRQVVARAVIKSLPLLQAELSVLRANSWQGAYFEPVRFFEMIQSTLPDLRDTEKTFLQNFVASTKKANPLPTISGKPIIAFSGKNNTVTITGVGLGR
jgi:hypothetical protein